MNYHVRLNGRSRKIVLGDLLGRGGEADVFRTGEMGAGAAKVYHRNSRNSRADRTKLEAMIATPPEHAQVQVKGKTLPLFGWPTQILEDDAGICSGFLMPEIALDSAVTLQTFMSRVDRTRLLSAEDCSLPRRMEVCRNLAAAIAELHRRKHYFVDIKPQNIYLFRDTGIVSLVDNDSFAITSRNGQFYPATAITAEYIAPELLRNNSSASSVADDRQDCFALAVLMFRLLDNGWHPFQGIPVKESEEWNIDLCVERGYYPHGRSPSPAIKPPQGSTYELWDVSIRLLFDRAFASANPQARPSAAEWRDHFDVLQKTKGVFVACTRNPGDVRHIHFANRACPECKLQGMNAPPSASSSARSAPLRPHVSAPSAPVTASALVAMEKTLKTFLRKPVVPWTLAAFLAIGWFTSSRESESALRDRQAEIANLSSQLSSTGEAASAAKGALERNLDAANKKLESVTAALKEAQLPEPTIRVYIRAVQTAPRIFIENISDEDIQLSLTLRHGLSILDTSTGVYNFSLTARATEFLPGWDLESGDIVEVKQKGNYKDKTVYLFPRR